MRREYRTKILFLLFSQDFHRNIHLNLNWAEYRNTFPQKNPFHYYKNLTHFNVLIFFNSKKLAVTWRLRCYFFAALWPAWLKIWVRPPPFLFLFFDTRRRSSLIAYRSLKHLTVTHTDTHIRLNQKKRKEKKKKHTPQLHRWGGHRYQMRFVSKRAPMAVWGVCLRSTHGAVDLWTPPFFFF